MTEITESKITEYAENNLFKGRTTGYSKSEARVTLGDENDTPRCRHSVTSHDGWARLQCSRKGKYEEAGYWWCGTHAPSKVLEKRAESRRKMDAKYDLQSARFKIQRLAFRVADKGIDVLHQRASFDELMEAVGEYANALEERDKLKEAIDD